MKIDTDQKHILINNFDFDIKIHQKQYFLTKIRQVTGFKVLSFTIYHFYQTFFESPWDKCTFLSTKIIFFLNSNESNLGIFAFLGFSFQIILAMEMRFYYVCLSVTFLPQKILLKLTILPNHVWNLLKLPLPEWIYSNNLK